MKLPRNAQLWLPGYARDRMRRFWQGSGLDHPHQVWLTIADHFEPYWRNQDDEVARRRVADWSAQWPEIARRNLDSTGVPAQYTFFYPEEEYRPELLDALAAMHHAGLGDVEIHLHHDGEGRQNFIDRMSSFMEKLDGSHGLLHREDGRVLFGFIHGNWALDNGRPDGRYCGLNDEITILRDLGCYADFTMPSGSDPTQARMVNTIYWAIDDPARARSYDTGVSAGERPDFRGDLLMIPGPLGIRWQERLKPRMECAEIASYDLASAGRVSGWLRLAPRIGRNIFIKLHTHGTQERHSAALLKGGLDQLFQLVKAECDRGGHALRYVTAWGMRQAVLGSLACLPA
jgi:hypothetical protein